MAATDMIKEIDATIACLKKVKKVLQGSQKLNQIFESNVPKRKPLSAEGRRKIAEAQRARWRRVKAAMKS
jgi:hypothetical protein